MSQTRDLDTSTISRRYDAAKQKAESDIKLAYARDLVAERYASKIAESKA